MMLSMSCSVYALPSSGSAAERTNSMISFFQNAAQGIDTGNISRNELGVYSVFLSNFYLPGVTRVSDITSSDISEILTKQFIGEGVSADTMTALNGVVKDIIVESMTKSDDSILKIDGQTMTGKRLAEGMAKASDGTGVMIQTSKSGSNYLFALNDDNVRAVWTMLLGVNPEFFFDADNEDGRGLFQFESFRIDCFGNIWGSLSNQISIEKYVLVMPACLNPHIFAQNPEGSTMEELKSKLPLVNSIATGAMVGIGKRYGYYGNESEMNALTGADGATVNDIIKQKRENFRQSSLFGMVKTESVLGDNAHAPLLSYSNLFLFKDDGLKSSNNSVLIYGVNVLNNTAMNKNQRQLGNSDTIKKYVTSPSESKSSGSEDYVMVVFDTTKDSTKWHSVTPDWADGEAVAQKFQNLFDDSGNEKGKKILTYLETASAIPLNNTSSSFSWFNFNAKSENDVKGLTSAGVFAKDENLKLSDVVIESSIFKLGNNYTETFVSPLTYLLSNETNDGVHSVLSSVVKQANADNWINSTSFADALLKGNSDAFNKKGKEHPLYMEDKKGANQNINAFCGLSMLWYSKSPADEGGFGGAANEANIFIGMPLPVVSRLRTYADNNTDKNVAPTLEDVAYTSIWKGFTANRFVLNILNSNGLIGGNVGDKVNYKYTYFEGTEEKESTRQYTINNFVANGTNAWASIYWSYMRDLLFELDESGNPKLDANGQNLLKKFYYPHLPESETFESNKLNEVLSDTSQLIADTITSTEEFETAEDKQNKLLDTALELVKEGKSEIRNNIILNTLNGWLIATHKAITGSDHSTSLVGNVSVVRTQNSASKNSYSSIVGYISTPKLSDVPFTSWVLDNYLYIYIFLMLLISMCLVMMVLTNLRTWQQGVFLFIVMAFVLVLPQTLLNNAIILGNKFADSVFSDRFMYWAITEHETNLSNTKLASAKGDLNTIISENLYKSQNAYDSYTTEAAGVKVKWMAPKKHSMFNTLFTDVLADSQLEQNLVLFKWLFSSFFTGDEYATDDPFATYVYRSYTEIANDAKKYYTQSKGNVIDVYSIRNKLTTLYENDLVSEDAATRMKFIGADYYVDNTGESGTNNGIFDIYGNSYFDSSSALNVHTGFGWMQSHLIYSAKAHSTEIGQSDNEIMSSHVRTGTKITSSMGTWSHRYWHLSDPVILETIFKNPKSNENPGLTVEGDSSSGVQTFLAYAESPYYYFYNVLRERFSASGTDGFKKSMLMDSSYKHNATGMYSDDELRDFLDLEGLFTTVIPVLNQSNMYVREYEETFGLNIESYDFEGYLGEKTDSFNEAQEQKNKVRQVWMMYCPWVDYLYELDVTDETTKWGGKKVTVSDALNPGYYDEANRPMIYSKADMAAKHANESNLTTTEIRIQNVLDDTYKDMLYLLNYYDFSDEALISAAAMSATFNFNKEFSGSSLLGTNATIYPQSYELKNFNYDAFLRLAMMNATGIPLTTSDIDIYETILYNTSWWTGVLIIIEDLLACYAIPACKTAILLLLLYLGLIFCVACVVDKPEKVLKSLGSHILMPVLIFLLSNVAFSFVISMFTGEGLTSYVGSKTINISMQDPTVTVVLLIVVSCAYMYALIKLLLHIFKTFKNYGAGVIASVAGLVLSAGGAVTDGVKRLARGTGGLMKSGYRRSSHRKDMRDAFGGSYGNVGYDSKSGVSRVPRHVMPSNANSGSSNSRRQNSLYTNLHNSIVDKSSRFGGNVKQWTSSFSRKIGDKTVDISKRIKQDGLLLSATKAGVRVVDNLQEGYHKLGDIKRAGSVAIKHGGKKIARAGAIIRETPTYVKEGVKRAPVIVKKFAKDTVAQMSKKWRDGVTASKNYVIKHRREQMETLSKKSKALDSIAKKQGTFKSELNARNTNVRSETARRAWNKIILKKSPVNIQR